MVVCNVYGPNGRQFSFKRIGEPILKLKSQTDDLVCTDFVFAFRIKKRFSICLTRCTNFQHVFKNVFTPSACI